MRKNKFINLKKVIKTNTFIDLLILIIAISIVYGKYINTRKLDEITSTRSLPTQSSPSPTPISWMTGYDIFFDENGYLPQVYTYLVPKVSNFYGTEEGYWSIVRPSRFWSTELYVNADRNVSGKELGSFISFFIDKSNPDDFDSNLPKESMVVNGISGYKLTGNYRYVFLKGSGENQILIFKYKYHLDGKEGLESNKMFDEIISTVTIK